MNTTKIVPVRFNEKEYENLKNKANAYNMNVSDYIRMKTAKEGSTLMVQRRIYKELFEICGAVNVVSDVMTEEYPDICDMLEKGVVNLWNIISK